MTVEIETSADNEELSKASASLEFRLSEAIIRQAVRTHRLASIPHRWGLRVRRVDVAELASSVSTRPLRQSAPRLPRSPRAWPQPRTLGPHKQEREARILELVGELGEASISRIHQRVTLGGEEKIPYSTVAEAMHHLRQVGRLVAQEKRGRYFYRLPHPGEEAGNSMTVSVEAAPRPALTLAPRPGRVRVPARDTEIDEVARDTLAALRSIGRASSLDEIYRATSPRPAYVEVVRAVRRRVAQRLAVRIKHEHRYLYQVAE